MTIYIDENHWHERIGTGLLNKLIEQAPSNSFWCLYSSIYSSNENSINLHSKCGFRTIGYRERIAKDRFGDWTDTTMMEYRFPDEIVKEKNYTMEKEYKITEKQMKEQKFSVGDRVAEEAVGVLVSLERK